MVALVQPQDDAKIAHGDHDIILEALDRWKACKEWQGIEDQRARDDIKFANGS